MSAGLLAALTLLASQASLPTAYTCDFARACIDGRPCFDSPFHLDVSPIAGRPGLARLDLDGTRSRPASVERNGVWLTVTTPADLDQAWQVEVLDFAPDTGRATFVAFAPGGVPEMLSRTGICRAADAPVPRHRPAQK